MDESKINPDSIRYSNVFYLLNKLDKVKQSTPMVYNYTYCIGSDNNNNNINNKNELIMTSYTVNSSCI